MIGKNAIWRDDGGMEKARTTIGFDLDDVLFDFMGPLTAWHNTTHCTSLMRDDYFSFDLSEVWKCEGKEASDRIWNFYQSDYCKQAQPVSGAVKGLQALKDKFRFIIVTARPDSMESEIRTWLATHFGTLFDDVIFTNHYHGTERKRSKSSVCLEFDVRLFVDDALHNAHDIASIGVPVLLFDTPWNREKVTGLITRVFSWSEIIEKIQNI